MTERAPVVVIGIGNAMRGDDGVGPAAVEQLRLGHDPRVDYVTLDGESTRLLDAWRGRERAVVIDAVRSEAEPGAVHRLELGHDAMPTGPPATSTHGGGLAEALELGRELDRLPLRLIVLGVEAGDLSPGEGLSPAVSAALPCLVERVRAEVI
jgi:hydrogenase maturation protease